MSAFEISEIGREDNETGDSLRKAQKRLKKASAFQKPELIVYAEGSRNKHMSESEACAEAQELLNEWGSEFHDGLDTKALQQSFRNYNAATIHGLVCLADSMPVEMRTEWLNDRLERLNVTAHIPGMEDVAKFIQEHYGSGKQQGAEFELDWISEHKDDVKYVAVQTIEGIDPEGYPIKLREGVDVILKNGTYVELKCYDFTRPSYQKGSGTNGPLRQVERDIARQGAQDIKVVFDETWAKMPVAFRRRLEMGIEKLKLRYPHARISYETWKR